MVGDGDLNKNVYVKEILNRLLTVIWRIKLINSLLGNYIPYKEYM